MDINGPQDSILIVDDDETFTEVLANAFGSRDFYVKTALNGTDAKSLAQSYQFDKILLDLKLKQESGLTLLPQLLEYLPAAKIVVLTGYSSIATTVKAIKLGAANYLCKPADTDEILNAFELDEQGERHFSTLQKPSVDRIQWEHIQKTLAENNGNISATARSLGMHRRTLQRKLQKRPVKR